MKNGQSQTQLFNRHEIQVANFKAQFRRLDFKCWLDCTEDGCFLSGGYEGICWPGEVKRLQLVTAPWQQLLEQSLVLKQAVTVRSASSWESAKGVNTSQWVRMVQLGSQSLCFGFEHYRHRTTPNLVLQPLRSHLQSPEAPKLWLCVAPARYGIWKRGVPGALMCAWCCVLFLLSKPSAFSWSGQGTFPQPQGLVWGQMWQWGCAGALSKCLSSSSGLVLLVHKTHNAIIYRGFFCKYCESKEMRKNAC